jgi:FAD/FMN-containing dehydrogenase
VASPQLADLAALTEVVGADHVLVDDDVRAGYEVDWTGRFRGRCRAVVRPGSTAEVAAVVRWCGAHGLAVVPQGGNTGLVGGSVPGPDGDGVVVSLHRLQRFDPVDEVAAQVTVGAGVTLAALHERVRGSGWAFGVDLAARDSATIGGMIATNAGGIRVLRHGAMRAQVLGVEAVLGDGSVVSHLGGLVKDNTGYDLAGLLTGSEGTLGVVTAARLRLVPDPPDRVVVLAPLPSVAAAMALCARLRARVPGLEALEAVLGDGLALVCDHLGLAHPFPADPPVALLAEWAGEGDPPDALVEIFGSDDVLVAADGAGRERLWRYREAMTESISAVGVPHKLDVTLPLGSVAEFADAVVGAVQAAVPPAAVHLFGHLGDGNLHVNVTGVDPDDERVDDVVLRLVADHGGSISAEHGIGRAKVPWLGLVRSDSEIAAFAAIKAALDPNGVMNPGVLLPGEG